MERSTLGGRVAVGVVAAAAGYALADHTVPRLADHRGHFLIAHADAVTTPIARRPRRAAVFVVDGLSLRDAINLSAVQRLRARGRCARTHVGLPSISRPVYAVISSGVEQARTGVRNNDETAPARVDSIWQRARAAGMRVAYRSELGWWGELFPRGFDDATVRGASTDLFAPPFTHDLTLVHPVYIDDLSHDHGRDSPEVRAALARLDGELNRALDRLDLNDDLVALTSDHGHRDIGGHGGPAPEIVHVLSCFAGPGVRHGVQVHHLDSRDIAPTLAVLLGVAIPRHAATRSDPTAMISAVVDRDAVGSRYLDERLAGLSRIRRRAAEARASITGLRGARWGDLDALALRPRARRALVSLLASALAVSLVLRRALVRGERVAALGWCAAVTGLDLAVYRGLSGGLDATSLNGRGFFTRNVLIAALVALCVGAALHRVRQGSWETLSSRALLLVVIVGCANAAHVAIYGWPLGYPLPGPYLYFAPFLLSTYLLGVGVGLATISARALRRSPGS